jgi:hypothetical protein
VEHPHPLVLFSLVEECENVKKDNSCDPSVPVKSKQKTFLSAGAVVTTYFLCDKPESNARITWNVRLWGSTVARSTAYMREGRRTIMDHGAGEPDICICTVRTVLPFVRFCVYTFLPSTYAYAEEDRKKAKSPTRPSSSRIIS